MSHLPRDNGLLERPSNPLSNARLAMRDFGPLRDTHAPDGKLQRLVAPARDDFFADT